MKNLGRGSLVAFLAATSIYAGGDIAPVEPVVEMPVVQEEMSRAYNMGLKLGTLGVGVDLSTPINDNLAVRFNLNGLKYSRTEEIDDIDYDGDLELLTAGVLLDYFPFETAFRVSAGAYYNNNKFAGSATPNGTTVEINGEEYGIDDIGRLDTEVDFDKFAPYLGLGWGNDARQEGWGFTFDLGVMYHGEPKVDLDVVINNPALEAQIQSDVAAEKNSLLDEIEDFKFYPVVMIGVNYTF